MSDEGKLRAAMDAWEVEGAPPGFADRVSAVPAEGVPSTSAIVEDAGRRSWGRWGAVAIAGAAAVLLALWLRSPGVAAGRVGAEVRSTVSIPHAIVVTDAGASLRWRADAGAVQVQQRAGRVFYRVEPGAQFVVQTPLGRLQVKGTSFEVEVHPMPMRNENMKYAAGGVAVAAAVTVGLYEGRLVVAGDRGRAVLEPGQTAELRADRAPQVQERESLASLRDENRRLRDALHAERGRTRPSATGGTAPPPTPTADADDLSERDRVEACALTINGDLSCPMVGASQAVLDRRADCGVVVYDRPRALESRTVDFTELSDLVGLTADELAKLQRATEGFHDRMRGEFETIYRELGGEPDLAERLSAPALAAEIETRLADTADEDYDAISEQYAAALAGRQPRPELGALPAGRRHAFIWTAAGDLYQEAIAAELGPARAAELRGANDGWLGNRGMQGTPRCPEDEP